jgi:hypothetical protein
MNSSDLKTPCQENKWYYKKSFVILNLFFISGPIAFPLLWWSKEFSVKEKVFYTLLIFILTVIAVVLVVYLIRLYLKHYALLKEALSG